jgi:cytochrome b561
MRNDTPTRYGSTSRFLHWLIAVLVIWQLLKLGDRIGEGEHWIGQTLVPWHVSIGTLILLLAIVRLAWSLSQRGHRPQPPAGSSALAVRGGHFLLYAALLALPVTGTLYLMGHGYPLEAFGVQLIAGGDKQGWAHTIGEWHAPIAWLLLILAIGHIGMALIHHFIKRDDTLRRML